MDEHASPQNPTAPEETTGSTLILTLRLRPDGMPAFTLWQSQLVAAISRMPEFLNLEVLSERSTRGMEWRVLLRFESPRALQSWLDTDIWCRILKECEAFCDAAVPPREEVQSILQDGRSGVTEVIVTQVKPGMQDAYRRWEARTQLAQSKYPGYLGSMIQPPTDGEERWTTFMRFATTAHLEAWLNSPERAALLKESKEMVDYAHLQKLVGSFPGWVPQDAATGEAPPNWKTSMLVLLGLFPIVILEIRFLSPWLAGWNSSLATFFANSISVALTTWITMPLFIRWFRGWLYPEEKSSVARQMAGTGLILLLFAIEVALFWRLLS